MAIMNEESFESLPFFIKMMMSYVEDVLVVVVVLMPFLEKNKQKKKGRIYIFLSNSYISCHCHSVKIAAIHPSSLLFTVTVFVLKTVMLL